MHKLVALDRRHLEFYAEPTLSTLGLAPVYREIHSRRPSKVDSTP